MLGLFYFLYPWYRLNVCSKTHVLKPNPQCHVIWRCSLWDTLRSLQFGSIAQSCLTLCNPMDCSTPGFPVHQQLPEPTQTHVHCVSDAIQPSHPLSSPSPPAFSLSQYQGLFQWVSLHMRWPKYWSFSFNINPSSEYSGLISFRIDLFDLLAVQDTLKSLLQHHSSKAQFFGAQPPLWSNSYVHTWLL